jgi:hypothetical protein
MASQLLTSADEFSTRSDTDRNYPRKKSREGTSSQMLQALARAAHLFLPRINCFENTSKFVTVKIRDTRI